MALTKREFSVVERFIAYHSDLLSAYQSHRKFLEYIAGRTLRFHKYQERIPISDFILGSRISQHLNPWGLRFSQGSFYRCRSTLRDRGLLDYEGRGVVWYRLNLPGILGGFIQLAHRLNDTQTVTMLAPLLEKTTKEYRGQEWAHGKIELVENVVDRMEKTIAAGRKQGEETTKRQVEKAMKNWWDPQKEKGNTRWIRPKMQEWAEEAGLIFEDTWRKREAKSAQNFLKYCANEDRDPREWLYQICMNWTHIRDRLAMQEFPNQRHISNVVSFSEYFNNRKHMDKILAEILAEPEREVTVISIADYLKKIDG